MPTARPRIVLTETDELTRTLDVARRRWPEDAGNPSRLLRHLAEAGRDAILEKERRLVEARRQVTRANAGAATGMYRPGYLGRIRDDWPE